MNKLRMEIRDMGDENVKRIAALFPNCVTEADDGKGGLKRSVNFELLKQMLSPDVVDGAEHYEFTWVGKKKAIVEANKPIRKTLRPCKEESKNWDTTENLYIEGDNLEVLKLLQESYLGKVKMIYIDPPYNTGNDFIYNDEFAMRNSEYQESIGEVDDVGNRLFKNTETNGRFHSDWCSMMYSRLMLARNLLADDGVIFISIGEEEVQTLKEMCGEVYGEANFRNTIVTRRYDKNLSLQFVGQGLPSLSVGYEYILMYSKSTDTRFNPVYRKSNEARAEVGYWKGFWNDADRPTMRYDILGVTPTEGQWKWRQELAEEAVQNYKEYIEKFSTMTLEEYWHRTGSVKKFVRRNPKGAGKNKGVEHWVPPSDKILRNSNWTDVLASKSPAIDIPFDSPKNPEVIEVLLKLSNVGEDGVVLDFFSGSATTAHAVMQLNSEDGGHRKFIMVQLPELCNEKSEAFKAGYKNICEIGKERIRRAGEKIMEMRNDELGMRNRVKNGECGMRNAELRGADNSEFSIPNSSLDIGFRVLKVADSNMKDVYYAAGDYTQDLLSGVESNIKDDRTDLDLLFGCLLDWGLTLSCPYSSEKLDGCTVHTYNDGDLVACFDATIPESVITAIAKRKPLRAVFRDAGFASSPEKINVFEIFKLYAPETSVKVI